MSTGIGLNLMNDGLVWANDFGSNITTSDSAKFKNIIGSYNASYDDITATTLSNGNIEFDGTDGMEITNTVYLYPRPDSNTLSQTWEVYVRPDSTADAGIFGHKVSNSCSYFCNGGIRIDNVGKWTANWYDNTTYHYESGTSPAINTGQWYHVVATFDSSDTIFRLYVDGTLHFTGTSTNLEYSTGGTYMVLGWNYHATTFNYFDGAIKAARYYQNKALSLTEIQANNEYFKSRP